MVGLVQLVFAQKIIVVVKYPKLYLEICMYENASFGMAISDGLPRARGLGVMTPP